MACTYADNALGIQQYNWGLKNLVEEQKMMNDTLANALSKVLNHEKRGRKECLIHPSSKVITKVFTLLNKYQYLGKFEESVPEKGGILKVYLLGRINKVGAIKPRFSVAIGDYEKFEKRYLPAKGMGVLLVSTSKGILTHEEAKKEHIGGKLLAYCY